MFRTPDIGVDIGNSKFSICVKGEGVVASEPAYLAYQTDALSESSVVAWGEAAKRMYERSHPEISVMSPMSEGVVVDCYAASILLKRMAKSVGIKSRIVKPKIVVGSLFGASGIERRSFRLVGESLGCSKIYVVHEPLAAAIGTNLDISGPYANMIVDVGDGATEALVVSQNRTILGDSIRFGGSNIDLLLIDKIQKDHSIKISISEARKIKEILGENISESNLSYKITVRGINIQNRLPCKVEIPVTSISGIFHQFADKISSFVLSFLRYLPPEVSVDLIENGIHLCGGASQSQLIKSKIEVSTGLTVSVEEQPRQTVITGIHKMLDFAKYFV